LPDDSFAVDVVGLGANFDYVTREGGIHELTYKLTDLNDNAILDANGNELMGEVTINVTTPPFTITFPLDSNYSFINEGLGLYFEINGGLPNQVYRVKW